MSSRIVSVLSLDPRTGSSACQDTIDHAHVGQRIGDRYRGRRVVQDRLRQRIALQGVLVADIKHDFVALPVVRVNYGMNVNDIINLIG